MKNVHVLIMFWDFGIGGVQTRLQDIITSVLDRTRSNGNTVTLLLKRHTANDRVLPDAKGLHVFYYSDSVHAGHQGRFFIWLLLQILKQKPTHILAILNRFTVVAVIAKYILQIGYNIPVRVIINQVVYTSKYISQYERWYWHILVAIFYRLADAIVLPTNAMKHDLVQTYKLKENGIYVIPSWIKKKTTTTSRKVYAGVFVGRLAPEKRIQIIVRLADSMKLIRSTNRIAIIGDGELREWLISEIKRRKLQNNLLYLGFRANPIEIIRKSHVLLLPSVNEGLPMTVLESAAVGIPSIVQNYPGSSEVVIQNKTGWICSESDYVNSAVSLLRSKEKFRIAGKSAQIHVRKYHSLKNLEQFVDCVIYTV